MRLWHILLSRVRSLLLRNRREDDLDEELQLHIVQQADYWIAQGVDAEEARLRARRQFGNVESLKEESRDARGTGVWDALVRDTRHAARRLFRDWRFSVPAVLLLGLGIGANTAIFSIVNATLFRPSPFADSERLVEIYQNTKEGAPGTNTYPVYLDVVTSTNVFAHVMAVTPPLTVSYREGLGPVRNGTAEYATPSFPAVLGIQPSLGRWFTADEERLGAPLVAVVGHQAWTTRFGADPSVIGRTVYVQGLPTTIIGVGPAGYRSTFDIGLVTDFWLPIASALGPLTSVRRAAAEAPFFVRARLHDGVTRAQAQAAMDVLGRRLAQEYPDEDPGTGISVYATDDVRIHPQVDTFLFALASLVLAVVGLVLAVACSNLATLLLVRAATRAKEVSIRLAIGATRWQVVRHLLAESLLLSLAGGVAGCTLAWWLIRSLRAVELPITVDFSLDARVLAFAVVLSAITGVLFGLAPALHATRLDLLSAIRGDGQTGSSGLRWFTLRNGLVVFQVTASVVMLTATGAFMQMGVAIRDQRLGYGVEGVAWLETDARYSGYTAERATAVYDELRRRVGALPGVQAVTQTQDPPMTNNTVAVVIEGTERVVNAGSRQAAPGFFHVMQIPILVGRAIDARDRPGSPLVAVITESMARTYFGGLNAVGRRFRLDQKMPVMSSVPTTVGGREWFEVIGVAPDTGGDVADPERQAFYYAAEQAPLPVGRGGIAIITRTSGDAAALVRDLQRELLAIDPSLPIFTAMTMKQRVEQAQEGPYAVALSLGALGALGLVLAGVGLYAVIAFAVSRREREIGIRMALGARSGDVVGDVARDVAVVLGAGAGVGLVFAIMVVLGLRATSNTSTGMVNIDFYPPSVDPLQLAAIVAFIGVVGVVAAFVPARRAARMSPLSALRRE
jgi:predicted permease